MWGCDVPPANREPEAVERLETEAVVRLDGGGVARTTIDAHGRAVQTTYETDGRADVDGEVYHYDDGGRLIAIDESPQLWYVASSSERLDTGGRLTVAYDDSGEVGAIVDEHGATVWERPTLPWPDRLSAAAEEIAAQCRQLIADAVQEAELAPAVDSYGVALTYVDQGSLHITLAVGLEEDRRAAPEDEDGAMQVFYVEGDLAFLEDDVPSEELDLPLLRDACVAQPDDPYRTVLGEVARRLSLSAIPALRKTDDFVCWIAEHDEGFALKVDSIRLHNAPDAVLRWEQGWGRQVLPWADD